MTDKIYNLDNSNENLSDLAIELAENYFDNASIDVFPDQRKESSDKFALHLKGMEDLRKKVLNRNESNKILKNSSTPRRNILVVGAGASYNAFKNIPLGGQAIIEIHKKLIVVSKEESGLTYDIDFDFFIRYFKSQVIDKNEFIYNTREKFSEDVEDRKKEKEADEKRRRVHNSKKAYLDRIFVINHYNEFKETTKLHRLYILGNNYFEESDRLKLYSSDYRKTDYLDFESSLNILVKLFNLKTIRDLIQNLYDYRYGETLFYQIVAHLFKNGFIDVVINFNFDELLDEAIVDEMGEDSYDYIFSDGDCKRITELEKDGRLRQPLYIKPHGTASYKSSMKFTKDHYYELPADMKTLLAEVISSREDDSSHKEYRKTNVITVGFEMESLEFNEILKNHLPEESKIFSVFHHKKKDDKGNKISPEELFKKIENKRAKLKMNFLKIISNETEDSAKVIYEKGIYKYELKELYIENNNKPEIKFIGHEFYNSSDDNIHYTSLASTFIKLYEETQILFKEEFRPSSIGRHKIIGLLFGNPTVWKILNNNDANPDDYPKYFKTAAYFKDRTIIECLIDIVTNRGFINVASSMKGVVGKYYALYYEKFKEENKHNDEDLHPEPIIRILKNLMNDKNQEGKEIKPLDVSIPDQYENSISENIDEDILKRIKDGFKSEVFSEEYFFDKHDYVDVVKKELDNIYYSNATKIQPKFRSTVHHAFSEYDTKDLITSSLLNDLYFFKALDSKADTIYAIVDYGHQLSKFCYEISKRINKISKIRLILQYNYGEKIVPNNIEDAKKVALNRILKNFKKRVHEEGIVEDSEKLYEELKNKFDIYFLPIRQHNHHMTLLLNEEKVVKDYEVFFKKPNLEKLEIEERINEDNFQSAVYYYKIGLSVNINPIRIRVPGNQKYLVEKFLKYVVKAENAMR